MHEGPLIFGNGWLSPIHHSDNGVHADFNFNDGTKIHIPFSGQTTLDMFRIGSIPSNDSYQTICEHGFGSLKLDKIF